MELQQSVNAINGEDKNHIPTVYKTDAYTKNIILVFERVLFLSYTWFYVTDNATQITTNSQPRHNADALLKI